MSEDKKHTPLHFKLVKHSGNDLNAILPAAIEICPSEGRSFYHVIKPSHHDVEVAEFIVRACNSHYKNAEKAHLANALALTIAKFGEWDDGCFYYNKIAAPELGYFLEQLAKAEGK